MRWIRIHLQFKSIYSWSSRLSSRLLALRKKTETHASGTKECNDVVEAWSLLTIFYMLKRIIFFIDIFYLSSIILLEGLKKNDAKR